MRDDWEEWFKSKSEDMKKNPPEGIESINKISKNLSLLVNSLDITKNTLESKRIPVSLERFDDWFHFFLTSQNLRWCTIELLLPLIIGGTSLLLLFDKLFLK